MVNNMIYGGLSVPSGFVFDYIHEGPFSELSDNNVAIGRFILIKYCDTAFSQDDRYKIEIGTISSEDTKSDIYKYHQAYLKDNKISKDRMVYQKVFEDGGITYKEIGYINSTLTNEAIQAIKDKLDTVTNVMDFVGQSIANPVEEGAAINGVTEFHKGDIVLFDGKEYVNIDGSNKTTSWEVIGDASRIGDVESALNKEIDDRTKADNDIKAIQITGTGYLTGGGNLTANRTIDLSSEKKKVLDRANTDGDLDQKIAQEKTAREDTDKKLSEDLAKETKARTDAINNLNSALTENTQNLQTELTNEKTAREQADINLEIALNTLNNNLQTEEENREKADSDLRKDLNQEVQTRKQADDDIKKITITGTGYLTGGGDLTTSREIDLSSDKKTILDRANVNGVLDQKITGLSDNLTTLSNKLDTIPGKIVTTLAGGKAEIFNDYSGAILAHGNRAHCEGEATEAWGENAHAEGRRTHANANYAHAEGSDTWATSNGAHAEGVDTHAKGSTSHAEGYLSKAVGYQTHAQNLNTYAEGNSASAAGHNTRACHENQFVIGVMNINKQENLFEIGNGSVDKGYNSNAFEVRRNGDAYVTGDLYINNESNSVTQQLKFLQEQIKWQTF